MRKLSQVLLVAACVVLLPGSSGRCETSGRPHELWTTQTKTATATSNRTDTAIWTPASGKRIALQGVAISAGAAGVVEIESSDTDVIPLISLESGGLKVIAGNAAPLWTGGVDATLAYTNTGGFAGSSQPLSILLWGYEY